MAKRYDDDDDNGEDMPSVRRRDEPLSGMNAMYANTNIVVLIFFSLCCNGLCLLPLILSIIGVATCTDEKAKSNAKLCLIISGLMVVVQFIGGFIKGMIDAGGGGMQGFK